MALAAETSVTMDAHIDAHQHFWRYDAAEYGWITDRMHVLQRDFLPDDLRPLARAAGVHACVAVQVRQDVDENRYLLDLADEHAFVAGVVGWVDLQSPSVRDQLEQHAGHPKFVGVRHIVQDEPDDQFLIRPAFCDGIAQLAEFDLAYDILIYRRHLDVAAELVRQFPHQRFVLDHLAKPAVREETVERRAGRQPASFDEWRRGLRALADLPNVYAKMSGLVTEASWTEWTPRDLHPYLDVALDCFGPERLMIGSDWPVCTLAGDYGRTLSAVSDYVARLSRHERAAILGGTAKRFYKLPMVAD